MSDDNDIVCAARRWIGTPYVHQASVRGGGTDCLGLLRGIWRELIGEEPVPMPAYTPDWAEPQQEEVLWTAARTYLRELPHSAPLAGQVILFRMKDGGIAKHLGVVSRSGMKASFIHAYGGHGVVESALTEPWSRRIVAQFEFPKRRS